MKNFKRMLGVVYVAVGLASHLPLMAMQPSLDTQIRELIGAINKGDDKTALQLLRQYPALARKKESQAGNTALFAAAKNGRIEVAKDLLKRGSQPNEVNNYGESPLHAAARNNHDMILVLLAKYGGSMTLENARGETPRSLRQQKLPTVAKPVQPAAQVLGAGSPGLQKTPQPIQKGAVSKGAQAGSRGITLEKPKVSPLVKKTVVSPKAVGAAVLATARKQPEKVVEKPPFGLGALVVKPVKVTKKIEATSLPIDIRKIFWGTINAITKTGDLELVRKNVEKYPDFLFVEDTKGMTLLAHAAKAGQYAIAKLLLDKGAAVNQTDKRMSTPLQYAVVFGQDDLIKLLRQKGGIVYARLVIMLQPDFAYRYTNIMEAFGRRKYGYLSEDVREGVELVKGVPHITLAYLSIPMNYESDEGLTYRHQAQEYLEQFKMVSDKMGFIDAILRSHFNDPFKWDKVKWLSNFLVVSYIPPHGYNEIINRFYQQAKKVVPTAVKTYKEEEQPHISVMKIKPASGITTDAPLVQKIASGTPQKQMFEAGREEYINTVMSIRIPSKYEENKYYEYVYQSNLAATPY